MLTQAKSILEARIVSLHTGQSVGSIQSPILNPHKLELVGFYVQTPRSRQADMVLLTQDIRQANNGQVFIDSVDEITSTAELHRHQEIFNINFKLAGKPVRTSNKKKLGKVEDYVLNTSNWQIQKIYVKQPVYKSFTSGTLIIDRSQIVEVTDKEITVTDATATKPALATPPAA